MVKIKKTVILIIFLGLISFLSFSQNKPFPCSQTYPNCIKPSNYTQAQLNSQITDLYQNYWKPKYLKTSNGATPGGGYYINMEDSQYATCSEAHGYGMMIFVLMAGYDANTKTYFDGMYNMYDKHRSTVNHNLMSWSIAKSELTSEDSDSATDGDLDIAYALLMAHDQWGSAGSINYLAEAKRIITSGIKASDMSALSKRINLGDWSPWNAAPECYWTRSSDWMASHMRVFAYVTGDSFFTEAADKIYAVYNAFTAAYSSGTGLVSDFVVNEPPQPAPEDFLEGKNDNDYSWNACRFPWRIAMDYAYFGTAAAKTALNKIIGWLKVKHSHPADIMAGYYLNGTVLPDVNYSAMCFTAPFMCACIVDSAHQSYLNTGWQEMLTQKEGYFEDTINLLCMLFISGNWWKPAAAPVIAKDDLVGTWSGQGVWQRNSDTEGWTQFNAAEASLLAMGDFDGNGKDDLAGAYGAGLWLRFDNAAWQKVDGVTNPQWLAAGDLNADGKDDLLGVWTGIGVWVRYSGSNTWARIHTKDAWMIGAGDFDKDGKDDFLGVWDPEGIWVKYATGTWLKVLDKTDLVFVTTGDMNGDGRGDILGSWTHGVWYYNFSGALWTRLHDQPVRVAAGDLDGDSKDDLIGVWTGVPGLWAKLSAAGTWKKMNDSAATWFTAGKMR